MKSLNLSATDINDSFLFCFGIKRNFYIKNEMASKSVRSSYKTAIHYGSEDAPGIDPTLAFSAVLQSPMATSRPVSSDSRLPPVTRSSGNSPRRANPGRFFVGARAGTLASYK